MSTFSFILNGERVSVDTEGDVRLLWVIRDLLGVTGPKYGCGLAVCRACTSHINGQSVRLCAVPVDQIDPDDEIITIEGLADTVDTPLHPVQEVWLEHDVAQCGFCQPGQIMTAVSLIEEVLAEGRDVTEDDLDGIRNICRCGTYPRIRDAVRSAAVRMRELGMVGVAGAAAPAVLSQAGSVAGEGDGTTLPATGSDSLLAPATLAAGAAVAVRVASRRASSRAVPAEADAGEAERGDS